MAYFYTFYTSWIFLIAVMSICSLGFVIDKYRIHGPTYCDVTNFEIINYDLYYLMLFLLPSTFVVCVLQIIGFVKTRYMEWSTLRTTINIMSSLIFVIQFIMACAMMNKLSENHDCVKYYTDNSTRNALLTIFIGIFAVYITQLFVIFIAIVLLCINNKKNREYYTNYISY